MANAIKKISVARGYDVTRYTLQCFGGAGGQHACQVADALGMSRVFVHPLAGVLSAYGMGLADQSVMREAAIEKPLADAMADVEAALDRAGCTGRGRTRAPGRGRRRKLQVHRRVHVRYQGTDSALVVPFGDAGQIRGGVRGRVPAALRVPDAGVARSSSRRYRSKPSVPGEAPAESLPRRRSPRAPRRGRARAPVQRRRLARRRARAARTGAAGPRDRRARPSSPSAMRPPSSSRAGGRA